MAMFPKPGDILEFVGEYFLPNGSFEWHVEPKQGLVVEITQNNKGLSGPVAVVYCGDKLFHVPLTEGKATKFKILSDDEDMDEFNDWDVTPFGEQR